MAASPTTLEDIHPLILQTHILPRLDGPSLSTTATVSSPLHALCKDDNLWSHVSKSTWPSITHPRIDDVISTFPQSHRSFFEDSFPALIADVNHRRSWSTSQPPDHLHPSSHRFPSELISAVDIRYQDDVIYSKAEFTPITTDFLSSPLRIELTDDPTRNRPGISKSIDLEVDELAGADEATLLQLKESMTLNWIVIDPTRKRAGNLSSFKAVSARRDWMNNETIVQYVTVLPGCDPNEMVKCRIQVVLGVGSTGSGGLNVKEVILKLVDMDSCCLNGKEFLVTMQGAILEENNVGRKVVDDERRWRNYKEFKEIKREKMEWVRKEEEKREFNIKMNYIGILVSFLFSVYFLNILLQ